MSFEGCPVIVVGMARSGLAAVRLLAANGAQVIAYDSKTAEELPDVVAALQDLPRVRLALGGDALVAITVEDTHTCYLGERGEPHAWGHGCGHCPACDLRAKGWDEWNAAGRPPPARARP